MEIPEDPGIPKNLERKRPIVWRMIYYSFAVLLLAAFTAAYVTEFQILTHEDVLFSLGLYGLVMFLHLMMQSLFAYLEIRRINKTDLPCSFKKTVALTIAGYQENPDYLKHCLDSCRYVKYPKDKLKIILVIDGNTEDDAYMMEMFKDVFHGDDVGTYVWKGNYHTGVKETQDGSCPEVSKPLNEDEGIRIVEELVRTKRCVCIMQQWGGKREELVRTKRCVCIMQQWGGKREAMYTAFRAIGTSVDYVQVCHSDTKLDKMATAELVKVLEDDEKNGAVGGDVGVLNPYDSFISFMSSLRYWVACNLETACQSYFGSVTHIPGSLGMFRNDVLQVVLEFWYNKTFLGSSCPISDGRYLTNRVLSMGYRTKYTHRSRGYAPSQYLTWLNQQTRRARSYFRVWLCNAQWWHKHPVWMTYQSVVDIFFPFFVTAVWIRLVYSGSLSNVVWLLLGIQSASLLLSLYVSWQSKKFSMVLLSLYSLLYVIYLLPCQLFALLTVAKTSWGRQKVVNSSIPLLPLSIWVAVLIGGVGYGLYRDCRKDGSNPEELYHVLYGCAAYVAYWAIMAAIYGFSVSCCKNRPQAFAQVRDDLPASLLV
uniref:Hyaluronan synthase-related sequence protein n=1 Tax=Xenopus tropicalis TaxID=8364 RepID=A0A803JEC0_XENTR